MKDAFASLDLGQSEFAPKPKPKRNDRPKAREIERAATDVGFTQETRVKVVKSLRQGASTDVVLKSLRLEREDWNTFADICQSERKTAAVVFSELLEAYINQAHK